MNNDVNRLLKIIVNYKKIIILILVISIAIGCIYSFNYKTPIYKSTASFVLVQNSNETESITQKDINLNQSLISTYSNIAKSNTVLKKVIDNLNLSMNENELKKLIDIQQVKDSEVLEISVLNENKDLSAEIANEVFNIFSEEVSKLYNISNIQIMDYAEPSNMPDNINHIKDILIFTIAGIGISGLIIGLIYLLDTTIKSEKDVETFTNLSVLSTIPLTDNIKNNELVTQNEPKSVISESFKTLRTNVMYSMQNKKLKTILVTSGYMGEGKSFISSNLAVTFAQSGKKVIFIDTDMRKGRLQKIFNITSKTGLSNCLADIDKSKKKIDINKYINKTEIPNLYLMTAGDIPPNPSELLNSDNMKKLLYTLNTRYDIVICDSAPCMLVTDSIILSKIVDTTVIVTSNKTTKITNLLETEKSIKLIGGNISGVIINKMVETKKEYKYGYCYGHLEELEKTNNIKIEKKDNPLGEKLYLQEPIQEEIIEEKNKTEEIKKENITKNNKQKEYGKEIKELKSLYKVLMKNTVNILLNKEDKAEQILDKVDTIKNTYRNDLEEIRKNQNGYEKELLELKNRQEEHSTKINNIVENHLKTNSNISDIKKELSKDIANLKRKQTITKKDLEQLNLKQTNNENLLSKIGLDQEKYVTRIEEVNQEQKDTKNELNQLNNTQNEIQTKVKELSKEQYNNTSEIEVLNNVKDEYQSKVEELSRMQYNANNQIEELLKKQEEIKKQINKINDVKLNKEVDTKIKYLEGEIKNKSYEQEINDLKEQFIEVQKNNNIQIEQLLLKIEKLQKENIRAKQEIKDLKENKNLTPVINTYDKLLEMQRYINSVEEKDRIIPTQEEKIQEVAQNINNNVDSGNTIVIKELQLEKTDNKYAIDYDKIRNRSKKVFGFFNRRDNTNDSQYNTMNESYNQSNDDKVISQILSGTN